MIQYLVAAFNSGARLYFLQEYIKITTTFAGYFLL